MIVKFDVNSDDPKYFQKYSNDPIDMSKINSLHLVLYSYPTTSCLHPKLPEDSPQVNNISEASFQKVWNS